MTHAVSASVTHDAGLRELRALAKKLDGAAVVGAFVASLGTAPSPWRGVWMALAAAQAVPQHRLGATYSTGQCRICGLRASQVLAPPREDGQVLPHDLARALAVLRAARGAEAPQPTKADVARMQRVLDCIAALPATAGESKLNAAMASAKVVVGGKCDRRHVIETLGAAGMLETPEHPGFTTRWTTFEARQARPSTRVETDPPIAFWRAAHGVNAENLRAWLGALRVKAPKPAAGAAKTLGDLAKSQAKRAARAARVTELAVGDVVAFDLGDRWRACIVVGRASSAAGTAPVIEVLAWKGKAKPDPEQLRGARAQGDRFAGAVRRAPVAVWGMLRADGRGWTRIARRFPPPDAAHLAEAYGRRVLRARDLIGWLGR
jgi:hypothetical protein